MKESKKLFCITVIILLTASNSFSTPLSGTYTVGSGGNYPTINSAVSEIEVQGVSGPVEFDILTGTYDEHISIHSISGTSVINTVTFTSQTGNPDDVIITYSTPVWADFNIQLNGASNIIIKNITISRYISLGIFNKIHFINLCNNIQLINNRFTNINGLIYSGNDLVEDRFSNTTNLNDILIENNIFSNEDFRCYNILLNNDFNFLENIRIINNRFAISDGIVVWNCNSLLFEKNIINTNLTNVARNGILLNNCSIFTISRNKFYGCGYTLTFSGNSISKSIISNNFSSKIINIGTCINILFIHNTHNVFSNTDGNNFFKISGSRSITLINNLLNSNFAGPILLLNDILLSSSDYNNIYNGNNIGMIGFDYIYFNNIPDFYSATGFDQHSISHPVIFQSPTDLHLAGSSIGDEQLAGIPNASVTDDIDGNPRNPLHPYKGADEVTDFPLPVELASFTSSVSNNNVNLNWTTASETNNSGFDVERRDARSETQDVWNKISFINGHGTTSSLNSYEFTDRNLSSGKYKYRLKQIDFNGNFEYHNLSDEVVIGVPEKFELSQNYPNPFNPSTNLEFGISNLEFVSLKVYDSMGKEVATLVNEIKPAGRYEVEFDGSNLSSGVYFYKIEAGSFSTVKRMILLK